jgi:hypothetical protein
MQSEALHPIDLIGARLRRGRFGLHRYRIGLLGDCMKNASEPRVYAATSFPLPTIRKTIATRCKTIKPHTKPTAWEQAGSVLCTADNRDYRHQIPLQLLHVCSPVRTQLRWHPIGRIIEPWTRMIARQYARLSPPDAGSVVPRMRVHLDRIASGPHRTVDC